MFRSVVLAMALVLGEVRSFKDTDWRQPLDSHHQSTYLSVPDDQYSCGGCYGFAEAAVLEWFAASVTGKLIELSTQFYVDCFEKSDGTPLNGCAGGDITDGLKYAMSYQYHPYKEDYYYTGNFDSQTCVDNGVKDRLTRNALVDVWVYDYIPLSKVNGSAIIAALENGPVIAGMYVSDDIYKWNNEIVTDSSCKDSTSPHAMAFVGWQSNNDNPYFIVRNSYGEFWGDRGYAKYADNKENLYCNYHKNAFSLIVGRRRELEYKLGTGKKKFDAARTSCQANGMGWDLAVIPTQMHNFEVYDMFTEIYGTSAKKDKFFNFIWIGMSKRKWVDGTEPFYQKWDDYDFKYNFAVMKKVHPGTDMKRGRWTTKPRSDTYRFVCSRYRAEECPRISQTAVDDAKTLTMYASSVISDDNITKEIVVGTVAVIECMDGYETVGPEVSACQADGTWSELPLCLYTDRQ